MFTPPNRNHPQEQPGSHGYQRPMSGSPSFGAVSKTQPTHTSSPATSTSDKKYDPGHSQFGHVDSKTLGREGGLFNRSSGAEHAKGEGMKLQYIREQRVRAEKDRVKNELDQKKRIFDHNKQEISQKELEIRRLQAELTRAELDVNQFDAVCKDLDSKIEVQKSKVHTSGEEIQKLQIQLATLKKDQEKLGIQLQHWASELLYKTKTQEQKHTVQTDLTTKKQRQAQEVDRLKGENTRLDREIRMLESKLRSIH